MKPEKDSPSPKKSNISPPRSPNKIASQKIEPDTTNQDKNTHQNGILEENGHHSRLDDFKVKNFLEVVASSNLFSIFNFSFHFCTKFMISSMKWKNKVSLLSLFNETRFSHLSR